jgi:hypothetical protein
MTEYLPADTEQTSAAGSGLGSVTHSALQLAKESAGLWVEVMDAKMARDSARGKAAPSG